MTYLLECDSTTGTFLILNWMPCMLIHPTSFAIVGNGINYGTFAYFNLPVTLIGLDADCETEYEFVIIGPGRSQLFRFCRSRRGVLYWM